MNANCATIPQSQTIIALCALVWFLQTEWVSKWNFRGWTRTNVSLHSAHLTKYIWMIMCYLNFPARPNYFLHMCECSLHSTAQCVFCTVRLPCIQKPLSQKGWGQSAKLKKHSRIWGKFGRAIQGYILNPCTKFPPNPTSRKVNNQELTSQHHA